VRAVGRNSTKNRLHLDFRLGDQTAEVDRLLALGARLTDMQIRRGGGEYLVFFDGQI
jgi:hypothetical protein